LIERDETLQEGRVGIGGRRRGGVGRSCGGEGNREAGSRGEVGRERYVEGMGLIVLLPRSRSSVRQQRKKGEEEGRERRTTWKERPHLQRHRIDHSPPSHHPHPHQVRQATLLMLVLHLVRVWPVCVPSSGQDSVRVVKRGGETEAEGNVDSVDEGDEEIRGGGDTGGSCRGIGRRRGRKEGGEKGEEVKWGEGIGRGRGS
jgi:hypothetical protein